MRTKVLILGLLCFFIFAHCNSPADPEIKKVLNPEPPDPIEPTPVIVRVKEYLFKMTIDFTDVLFPFPPPDYSYWEGYVHIYSSTLLTQLSSVYYRGAGIIEKEWTVVPAGGEESDAWQTTVDEIHTIKARYWNGRIPPEWQEKIRWRFQVNIRLSDSDSEFETTIWVGENEGNDTGFFDGWYATTPEWYDWQKITLFTFQIH